MEITKEIKQTNDLLRMIVKNENLTPLCLRLIEIRIKLNELTIKKQ